MYVCVGDVGVCGCVFCVCVYGLTCPYLMPDVLAVRRRGDLGRVICVSPLKFKEQFF